MGKLSNSRLVKLFESSQPRLIPSLSVKKINKTETDWRFIADINGNSYLFILLPCNNPYPSVIKQYWNEPGYNNENILLLSPYFSEGTQEYLNKNNLNFIDLSGNYRINRSLENSSKRENVSIRMGGKPNLYQTQMTAVDIFSPKSSRIIRKLLTGYPTEIMSKDLAQLTKVSPALVTKVISSLIEQGYIVMQKRKGIRVIEPDLLLDEWATQYTRKRKVSLGRYYCPINPEENLVKKIASVFSNEKAVITGSAGASLVAPFADVDLVEVYLDKEPSKRISGLTPVERGENVRLYLPQDMSIIENAQTKDGVRIADNLQLYLDLMCNPRRGKEQANYLKEQLIKFT